MKTVYAETLEGLPYIPLLHPNLGAQKQDSILFLNNAFKELKEPFVKLTDDPEQADAIVLAHNYPQLKQHQSFIEKQSKLALKHNKPFIVFWHGDSHAPVPYKHATVLRTSQYRGAMRSNETMMPAYAEDLLKGKLQLRKKHNGKPSIGFCGWANYKNFKNRIGTIVKNSLLEAPSLVGIRNDARVKGITFRMRALKHLQGANSIEPNFIIRSSYSGSSKTIKTDAEQTRKQYIDNMLSSDYALVIKGDGNYSYRFYEALSLGRIPVLLDTQCVLPLEDQIDYDNFVIRVPYYDLYQLDAIVANHFLSVSSERFLDMQRKAREAYEQYLSVGAFLQYAVKHYFV